MELWRYNPADIETALRQAEPLRSFPSGSDRAAWQTVGDAIGSERVKRIISEAEALAQQPVPNLPATLYLEYKRTGQREGYQLPMRARRQMMTTMALAECLEGRGRFLDPLMDVVWAILEESSWAMPAHQSELTDMERPVIDLGVAGTALALSEFDLLLGEQLDPHVPKRIRYEMDRRCFTPYLTRHDHWWMHNTWSRTVNNWTAVCTAGMVGAALYLEPDPARKAEIVARGARSMQDYMETFDPDGGSTEGPGYWGYGFGNFALCAQMVEDATGGRISFWEGEHVRKAARFPLQAMLSQGAYANFSDCDAEVHYPTSLLVYLSKRLDIPGLMQLARAESSEARANELHWALRNLLWRVEPEPAGTFVPKAQDWYSGMMWMFSRHRPEDPSALVLAAKGGHNGEMHNQNDVGSFIVRYQGESVLCELGRGRYTKAYFGPQRYEHFINSSLGHPVPVPNGQAQLPGREHEAELLDHRADDQQDLLAIEMRGAYPPEADLASLRRTFVFHRDTPEGWMEVSDEASFASGPGMLESALFTFGRAEVQDGAVLVRGERGALRVSFDPSAVTARVQDKKGLDLGTGPADAQQMLFALAQPAKQGTIRLRIEPA